MGSSHSCTALILDRLLFRPDISPDGADRASVIGCRRSLMPAVGCCCCCHRCCQPLVLVPIPEVSRRRDSALSFPGPSPEPAAAEPDGRRVLSRGGVADHEVTPQAPLTGSGWREHSYGGFGGGHPHFLPHAPDLQIRSHPYGHPDPFRSVRDLGRAAARCSRESGELEGRSSAWLPAWLPAAHDTGHRDAPVLVTKHRTFDRHRDRAWPCPDPSPEPDCCRTW